MWSEFKLVRVKYVGSDLRAMLRVKSGWLLYTLHACAWNVFLCGEPCPAFTFGAGVVRRRTRSDIPGDAYASQRGATVLDLPILLLHSFRVSVLRKSACGLQDHRLYLASPRGGCCDGPGRHGSR